MSFSRVPLMRKGGFAPGVCGGGGVPSLPAVNASLAPCRHAFHPAAVCHGGEPAD